MLSFKVLSFLSLSALLVPKDETVLLDDVIGRRLFKALLPRIKVLFARIAGFPAVKIESPVRVKEKGRKSNKNFYYCVE